MYTVYVVVLNQNTPVIGKTLFWGPGWRGGGGGVGWGQQVLVLFKGKTENFKAASGEQMIFLHMFPVSGAPLVVTNGTYEWLKNQI